MKQDQSAANIGYGNSVFNAWSKVDCNNPEAIAAAVKAATNKDCSVAKEQAEAGIDIMTRTALRYSKSAPLSASFVDRAIAKLPIPISNPHLVSHKTPVATEVSMQSFLTKDYAIPTESDTSPTRLTTMSGSVPASGILGTMSPAFVKSTGTTIDGIAVSAPKYGYAVRVQWDSGDIGTELRMILNTSSAHIATLKPNSDDCYECWLFFPPTAGTPVEKDGQVTFTFNGTAQQVNFIVYDGGSAASALGGWTAEVVEIPLTEEKLQSIFPTWNGRRFIRG